jgi:ABC-type multidrug transport system ATPase subunit
MAIVFDRLLSNCIIRATQFRGDGMLEIQDVRKRYGRKTVLDGVSHRFAPGLTLLVGPSGAGKSTLLRLLATAEKPNDGTIAWHGVSLPAGRSALRRTLGYAPQAVDLPADLTAREFALHIASLKGLSAGAADAQFLQITDAIGLHADANHRISTFSGGMRRRLILAQALLGSPELIVLDEPTAELDAQTAAKVNALIVARATTAVVVMTSHLEDAMRGAASAVLRVEGGTLSAS